LSFARCFSRGRGASNIPPQIEKGRGDQNGEKRMIPKKKKKKNFDKSFSRGGEGTKTINRSGEERRKRVGVSCLPLLDLALKREKEKEACFDLLDRALPEEKKKGRLYPLLPQKIERGGMIGEEALLAKTRRHAQGKKKKEGRFAVSIFLAAREKKKKDWPKGFWTALPLHFCSKGKKKKKKETFSLSLS